MANTSDITRKEQVLRHLQQRANQWVDGPELANERVGGTEGLRRLRELIDDGNRIVMRPHPDRRRDIYQYKLVVAEQIHPAIQQRLIAEVGDKADQAPPPTPRHTTAAPQRGPMVRGEPLPMRLNSDTGMWEVTKTVCVECEGLYEDEEEHLQSPKHKTYLIRKQREQDQQEIGVPPQPPQAIYTSMPSRVALGDTLVCPRCNGHRRPPRPERPQRRGGMIIKMLPAQPAEDFTRDPFKPTAKDGSPNRCPRCNGFGIIPAQGV